MDSLITPATHAAPALGNLLVQSIRTWERCGYHHGTRDFSRPLVPTLPIQAGPHFQLRYGHFAARDRPAHDRFGILALTFWTGHITPPLLDRTTAEVL